MTSGNLKFKLPGYDVSAEFVNGILKEGTIKIANIIYKGTFENNLLHGDYCSMEIDDECYKGKYQNGVFIEGVKIVSGVIVEYGTFTFSGQFKTPILQQGYKKTADGCLYGKFSNDTLSSGIKIINDKIFNI